MSDLAIIGAGVAGLTAAIAGRQAGLEVAVFERGHGPPERPGETLHPGVEPLFERLGVHKDVMLHATGRPQGIVVEIGGRSEIQAYGGPSQKPWRGFHIPRQRLHGILLRRAGELGADVYFDCSARLVQQVDGRNLVVRTDRDEREFGWLLDGTGQAHWSSRIDRIPYCKRSKPLVVSFSYKDIQLEEAPLPLPRLSFHSWGWLWQAALGDGRLARVKLHKNLEELRRSEFSDSRKRDATWLVSELPAKRRIFRIGDAAVQLDPSSGKGVIRAMMSSMMATHLIGSTMAGKISEEEAETYYSRWLRNWFDADVSRLRSLFV